MISLVVLKFSAASSARRGRTCASSTTFGASEMPYASRILRRLSCFRCRSLSRCTCLVARSGWFAMINRIVYQRGVASSASNSSSSTTSTTFGTGVMPNASSILGWLGRCSSRCRSSGRVGRFRGSGIAFCQKCHVLSCFFIVFAGEEKGEAAQYSD